MESMVHAMQQVFKVHSIKGYRDSMLVRVLCWVVCTSLGLSQGARGGIARLYARETDTRRTPLPNSVEFNAYVEPSTFSVEPQQNFYLTMRLTAAAALLSCCAVHAWTTAPLVQRRGSSALFAIKAERPDIDLGDLTGGRPGAIVETEEQLERKEAIFEDLPNRDLPDWFEEYGELLEMEGAEYDTDDPEAVDASTLGTWDIHDLKSKFDYEYDPATGDPDPNIKDTGRNYVQEDPKDADGIEIGWDPIFGSSNPIDTRTVVGTVDSYMVDEETRDDSLLTPSFAEGDPEISFNDEVRTFRKSLDIIETYLDPYLPETLPVPRHVAKWHGFPIPMTYPEKNYTNNRFTKEEDITPFDDYDPHRARKMAVQYARAKNCEWLPVGVSTAYHEKQREPYVKAGTIVGTLNKGDCDPTIVQLIQPALKILGSVAELLSIENDGTVFRFNYHGLMKNKFGMSAWTETLIRDCGVECTGVVFETGYRRRDPAYDGGDPWYGPY